MANLVALVWSGKFQSVVSRKYKFDQVNQRLDELKAGKIIGTAVLTSWKLLHFRLKIGLAAHTDIKVWNQVIATSKGGMLQDYC